MTNDSNAAGYKVALNPIQWMASADGLLDHALAPPLEDLLGMIRQAGYAGVHTGVPPDMSVEDYAALLERSGLQPAPGYYGIAMPEDGAVLTDVVEKGRAAAGQQAALGLDTMFLACGMSRSDPIRLATPGVGAKADQGRLEMLTGHLAKVAEAMKGEGVKAALHPHVGTWVETEAETRMCWTPSQVTFSALGLIPAISAGPVPMSRGSMPPIATA